MATCSAPTPSAAQNKRPVRLNPARRRAAKVKEAGRSVQSDPTATKPEATLSSTSGHLDVGDLKPAISQDKVKQAKLPNQKAIRALPASNIRTQPEECAKPHRAGGYPRSKFSQLSAPAVVTGGLVGSVAGAAILLGAGIWSQIAGVDSAILTTRTSKAVVDNLMEEAICSLKAETYNAPEALDMLRRTVLAYASTVPGGTSLVEHLFREINVVRRQRGGEADRFLGETRSELERACERGASANEVHVTVLKQLAKLSSFTSNATQDILTRNPGLRPHDSSAARKQQVPSVLRQTRRTATAA